MPAPPKPLRDHSVTLPLPERPGGNEFIVPNPLSGQPCKMTFYPPLPVPVPGTSLVAKFIDEPQQQRMRGGRAYPMGNCQLCGMPFQLDPQAPIPPTTRCAHANRSSPHRHRSIRARGQSSSASARLVRDPAGGQGHPATSAARYISAPSNDRRARRRRATRLPAPGAVHFIHTSARAGRYSNP